MCRILSPRRKAAKKKSRNTPGKGEVIKSGDQYKLRVSTLKPVALEFLIHDAHIPERGLAAKLNWKNYEKRFGQPAHFIHQKPLIMMLTFAEWLHLVLDKPPQIDLEILQAWQ